MILSRKLPSIKSHRYPKRLPNIDPVTVNLCRHIDQTVCKSPLNNTGISPPAYHLSRQFKAKIRNNLHNTLEYSWRVYIWEDTFGTIVKETECYMEKSALIQRKWPLKPGQCKDDQHHESTGCNSAGESNSKWWEEANPHPEQLTNHSPTTFFIILVEWIKGQGIVSIQSILWWMLTLLYIN